jgi:hypothetical protein
MPIRGRKRAFRSALRQAEELAEAADVVSYAAKPILLFYALSEASQPLAPAKTPHLWTLHSHGLECRSAGPDILRATVEPQEGQQAVFQAVTAAVDSPALAGKCLPRPSKRPQKKRRRTTRWPNLTQPWALPRLGKSCPVPWSCLCDLGPVDQSLASSAESGQLSSTRSPWKSTPGWASLRKSATLFMASPP